MHAEHDPGHPRGIWSCLAEELGNAPCGRPVEMSDREVVFFGRYLLRDGPDDPRDPFEELRRQKLMPQKPRRARHHDYTSGDEEKMLFT